MRTFVFLVLILSFVREARSAAGVDVLCIYYPEWHVYPEGEEIFGKGRTEWDFVDSAVPRFEGHEQPVRLLDGHPDDSDPKDVAKEIDYAADAGIDVFLYDWYWADGHPIQHEALERGFMKAPNRGRMKFAIMWAYHDRNDVFRSPVGRTTRRYFWKLKRNPQEFRQVMEYAKKTYFGDGGYYRKDGRLFFSIYNAAVFTGDMGGTEATRALLREYPEVHFNAMVINVAEARTIASVGFDSATAYGVNPYAFYEYPESGVKSAGRQVFTYDEFAAVQRPFNETLAKHVRIPFLPVVMRGWDASPRCALTEPFPWTQLSFPYLPIVTGAKAEIFARLVSAAVTQAKRGSVKPGAILVNAWNEYSEGSYLMPCERHGNAFLKALKACVSGR